VIGPKTIAYFRQRVRAKKLALAKSEERVASLKRDIDALIQQACDAGCDNDGNAHKPSCSIYKL
jgi:hypothetical protein